MWLKRPEELKKLDVLREKDPLWFQSNKMVGGVCYVDLFAENLIGIMDQIPYFNELGLTYLHLMPLYKTLDGTNDGGYAISSYREVNPKFGNFVPMTYTCISWPPLDTGSRRQGANASQSAQSPRRLTKSQSSLFSVCI